MSDAFGIDFGTTNSVLARATATTVDVWRSTIRPASGPTRLRPGAALRHRARDGQPRFGWGAKRDTATNSKRSSVCSRPRHGHDRLADR